MAFLRSVFSNAFIPEYSMACLLFLLPLNHRSRFPLRVAASFAAQYILCNAVLILIPLANKFLPIVFLFSFLIGVGMFLFCAELSINDAVFGATCSFAVQHMGYVVFSVLAVLCSGGTEGNPVGELLMFLCVAPFSYRLFAKKMPVSGRFQVSWGEAVRSAIIVLFFAYFLSMEAGNHFELDTAGNLGLYLICRTYACLCCFFVLWAQTSMKEAVAARAQLRTQELLAQKRREQYELSRDNIDLINRKCHDLKHQVAALRGVQNEDQRDRYLGEIERSVMIYDSVVKTGNEVLDTILTERSLSCEKEGISWTCMADGEKLGFMDPVDLYTIFGNALDNAIECVRDLKDTEKRVVSVNVFSKPSMVVLQVENYYEQAIKFSGGLPITSKEDTDYHGFGMRSIRSTAEKYGGSVSIDTENHIFLLCVVIPVS